MLEDKRRDRINRGQQAQFLIENPMFQEVMATLETEYLTQWKSAKDSPDKRESLWHCVSNLEAIRKKLNWWIDDAKTARRELERK